MMTKIKGIEDGVIRETTWDFCALNFPVGSSLIAINLFSARNPTCKYIIFDHLNSYLSHLPSSYIWASWASGSLVFWDVVVSPYPGAGLSFSLYVEVSSLKSKLRSVPLHNLWVWIFRPELETNTKAMPVEMRAQMIQLQNSRKNLVRCT